MPNKLVRLIPAALLFASVALYAADKAKPVASASPDPYAEVQPATESLDLNMYQRIREEGINHSHVMEFASALMDGIGPRLTGSPNLEKANEWTRDTLTKIGLENAHLEDWGEFGSGWQQLNTWVRMITPDTAVLIAQATPWSPSTAGPVTGDCRLRQHQGRRRSRKVQRQAGRKDRPLWSHARSSPRRQGAL
jgi:carboxypeptidase Q